MEAKDKKWESDPEQTFDDKRSEEQINSAKEEVDRRNENLEGGYKEKMEMGINNILILKANPKKIIGKPTQTPTIFSYHKKFNGKKKNPINWVFFLNSFLLTIC